MFSIFKKSIILQQYSVRYQGFKKAELQSKSIVSSYETFHRCLDTKELEIGDYTNINNKTVKIIDKQKCNKIITYYTDQYSIYQDKVSYIKATSDLLKNLQREKANDKSKMQQRM
jgi:hypothetical protein